MTIPPPKCLSILLCDQVIEDKRTNKKSFIGVFSEILSRSFPVKHDRMTLVVSLTDCRGAHEIEIEISRDLEYDTKSLVVLRGNIQGGDPFKVIDLVLELRQIPIEAEGIYTIDVTDTESSQRLGQRSFHVRKIDDPQPPRQDEGQQDA